jgi:hypothetical protein
MRSAMSETGRLSHTCACNRRPPVYLAAAFIFISRISNWLKDCREPKMSQLCRRLASRTFCGAEDTRIFVDVPFDHGQVLPVAAQALLMTRTLDASGCVRTAWRGRRTNPPRMGITNAQAHKKHYLLMMFLGWPSFPLLERALMASAKKRRSETRATSSACDNVDGFDIATVLDKMYASLRKPSKLRTTGSFRDACPARTTQWSENRQPSVGAQVSAPAHVAQAQASAILS